MIARPSSLRLKKTSGVESQVIPTRSFSSIEREQWLDVITQIYGRMKARALRGPYTIECCGATLMVLENVYAPNYFTDSIWFAEQLPRVVKNGTLLEIGTGTGIIAICCAKGGARVVATDINPDAVTNARLNVSESALDVSVRFGNLFEPIKEGEKFDFIFWAHPFNNWPQPEEDMLLRSGRDYEYQALAGYVSGARDHLMPGGKLLLGTGDSADIQKICSIAEFNGYNLNVLSEAKMPLEIGNAPTIRYLLCEFVPV